MSSDDYDPNKRCPDICLIRYFGCGRCVVNQCCPCGRYGDVLSRAEVGRTTRGLLVEETPLPCSCFFACIPPPIVPIFLHSNSATTPAEGNFSTMLSGELTAVLLS